MKTLFKTIRDRCRSVEGMALVDRKRGQLEEENPSLVFPCTLIRIILPKCETLSGKEQLCTGRVEIDVMHDISTDETTADADQEAFDNAFKFDEYADAVYRQLQGYSDGLIKSFKRLSRIDDGRRGIDVAAMVFEITFLDRGD